MRLVSVVLAARGGAAGGGGAAAASPVTAGSSSSTSVVLLDDAHELSSFGWFQRGGVTEMAHFAARTLLGRVQPGTRTVVEMKGYQVSVYLRADGVGGVAVTDSEYPSRVCFSLLLKLVNDMHARYGGPRIAQCREDFALRLGTLEGLVREYQDPQKADPLMRIQKDLDETRETYHKTIESMLERGEKLDDLMQKSGDLSTTTKAFADQASAHNSCCTLL